MYRCLLRWCLGLGLFLAGAHASVIYTNSAEVGNQLQACCNAFGLITHQGGNSSWLGLAFSLPGSGSYSQIGFDAVGNQTGAGVTTFAIFDDLNNNPGNQLASVVVTPSTGSARGFSGTFAGLTLNAGQTYYLVGETTALQLLLLASTTNTGGMLYRYQAIGSNGAWQPPSNWPLALPAFDITGKANPSAPVPEPATGVFAVVGFGAVLVGAWRLQPKNGVRPPALSASSRRA